METGLAAEIHFKGWLWKGSSDIQLWASAPMILVGGQNSRLPLPGGQGLGLHMPQDTEALETVRKEAWGQPCRHVGQGKLKGHLGPAEAPRSWGAPSRGLTGGWPGWCWVHSELGTARVEGRLST